jgi:hypothetical protein
MKMCFGGLFLLSLFCGQASVKNGSMSDLKLTVVGIAPAGRITMNLSNPSNKPLRIWEDANSWGAAVWRVLLIRNGQLETFYQNPDQSFTRNGPGFKELAAGAHIDKQLDLNGENWRGLAGKNVKFEPGDTIVIIYDVPATVEARKYQVWYGVASVLTTVQ